MRVSEKEVRTLVILAAVLLTRARGGRAADTFQGGWFSARNRFYRSDRFSHKRCLQQPNV